MRAILAVWLAGCTAAAPVDADPTGTGGDPSEETGDPSSSTSDDTLPTGLFGDVPDEALPPPTFLAVRNRDGTPRAQPDLIGHPTVMWFYPAAATGG